MKDRLSALLADRRRASAAALALVFGVQVLNAFGAFRAEMVHVAVQSRVERWEAEQYVATPAELEQAVTELDPAFTRAPQWAALYELRARLSLQLLNQPDLPIEALDELVELARSDLEAASERLPASPRPYRQQLGLDSLMYLAGSEVYAGHVQALLARAPTSRLYLAPLLAATTRDWERLDEATRRLTIAGLNDLETVEPSRVKAILRAAPLRVAVCDEVAFEC